MPVQNRKLGADLEVSAIGLGCMGMSFSYGPPKDKQEMTALLHASVERGVTFFDTAEVYGPFTNEELVGEALAPLRDRLVIATKFGFDLTPGFDNRPGDEGPARAEQPTGSYQRGRRGLAQAAQGRGHRPPLSAPGRPGRADRGRRGDGEGADPAGQGQAFRPLRGRRGRRSAGLMQSSRSRPSRANTRCGGGSPEAEVIPALEELGIGLVPYSPLGRGFLTGKIDQDATFEAGDFRSSLPRFTPEALKANQALVGLLGTIAGRKGATPARVALAWLLSQEPWIVPIPGTTKLDRLDENLGAASVELTPDDLREIDDSASKITVYGARYPERMEQMTGR